MRYLWKDKKTGTEIIIERKMIESDIPPDKDEVLKIGMEVEEYAEADWEKIITGGVGHIGFGQKGSW